MSTQLTDDQASCHWPLAIFIRSSPHTLLFTIWFALVAVVAVVVVLVVVVVIVLVLVVVVVAVVVAVLVVVRRGRPGFATVR